MCARNSAIAVIPLRLVSDRFFVNVFKISSRISKSFGNVAVRMPLFWFRKKCKRFTCKCKLRESEGKRDTCRIYLQPEENGSKKGLLATILKIEGRGKLHYLVRNGASCMLHHSVNSLVHCDATRRTGVSSHA